MTAQCKTNMHTLALSHHMYTCISSIDEHEVREQLCPGYSLGVFSLPISHSYSPSGKLVQIEYALQAVATGALSVGIRGAHAFRTHHVSRAFELVHVPHVH